MSVYREAPGPAPDVLVCSGLDPSGGAGFIADVRVVTALGARPVGVVTALTVQNTTGATRCDALDATLIRDQLDFLLTDVEVRAIKIGLVGSPAIAGAFGRALDLTRAPVVWDPVANPSRGDVGFGETTLEDLLDQLAPHLALLTPNRGELETLAGRGRLDDLDAAVAAAARLANKRRTAVLVKSGHFPEAAATDVLVTPDGGRELLPGTQIPDGEYVHGTGCALSSAIATYLARGQELVDACRAAKAFVAARIATPVTPGRGAAAVV